MKKRGNKNNKKTCIPSAPLITLGYPRALTANEKRLTYRHCWKQDRLFSHKLPQTAV